MDEVPRHRAEFNRRNRLPQPHMQHFQPDVLINHLLYNRRGRGRRVVYRYQGPHPLHHRAAFEGVHRNEPRVHRIKVDEDVLSFSGSAGDEAGLYISARTIEHFKNYFEIEILDIGDLGQISIGLVPAYYPINIHPGVEAISVGYAAENGCFHINQGRGGMDIRQYGPPCDMGDRMGVGVRPADYPRGRPSTHVFFTKNGQEIKSYKLNIPANQLFPAVGMQSEGEEVRLHIDAEWNPDDGMQMVVDGGEEDWVRLDDIRLNGMTLEYTGKGRSVMDVGLAQAKHPLNTTNHYFEFEIVDPGDKCYLAIGLAEKNYPVGRHPGWDHNSIAYHADDGKLFHGSGTGDRFGPKCSMGDTMGCGILFPADYDSAPHAFPHIDEPDRKRTEDDDDDDEANEDDDYDEADDDEIVWGKAAKNGDWDQSDSDEDADGEARHPLRRKGNKKKGTKVMVFFTRNGKIVGLRETSIPRGGFYPTIGMLSCNEKVRVDLRPLTG